MPDAVLKRPALGQAVGLGTLYDARSDTFVRTSLFSDGAPADAVDAKDARLTSMQLHNGSTLKEKFGHLSVSPELGMSILAGLVPVNGYGRYLNATQGAVSRRVPSSIHYTRTTFEEALNLTAPGIKDSLSLASVDTSTATHVVTGITWGAQCVVTAMQNSDAADSHCPDSDPDPLATQFSRMKSRLERKAPASGDLDKGENLQQQDRRSLEALDLSFFSDIAPEFGDAPTSLEDAQTFMRKTPAHINAAYGGKGCPIAYTLLPLSFLSMFRVVEVKGDAAVHQPNIASLEGFVELFDNLHLCYDVLGSYMASCRWYPSVVPQKHIEKVANRVQQARTQEAALRKTLAAELQQIRTGQAGSDALQSLLEDFNASKVSPGNLERLVSYADRVHFAESVTKEKAVYIGYGEPTLSGLLTQNIDKDIFVLYFNHALRSSGDQWNETHALFTEVLRSRGEEKLVLVADCDALEQELEKPYICQYRNGRVISDDLLEHRRTLATNCVMRCPDEAIVPLTTGKPLDRRQVKIPCPHPSCDPTLQCAWICATCVSVVEYHHVDEKLYCDCGISSPEDWLFRCRNTAHGDSWAFYDNEKLLQLLKDLEPWKELNILILGETGVGKSTWINAFVNYLTHDSLDSALESDLKWVIPCSFTTQMKDPSDKQGRFVQKPIKIGSTRDEQDGARGQSATQRTSVYSIDIRNTRVRLIDTPGIGDTRGLDQDNKNMADILKVLRTYKTLHGIMILLKPNAARLTVMFRFCIKQLLTHLHRKAAKNIVFGFTNTRGSNYKPGDTFKPLETLLKEYEKVEMGLFEHNVYCFDSESFRYLAARKMGVDIGLLEDNARSWEYSVQECWRLVEYVRGLTPHNVRSTINLNETRDMIVKLQEPMAMIAQKIQTSIAVNDDQIKQLRNTELSRTELEKSLYVQRESVEAYEVGEPRTVCAHPDCIEVRTDFEGGDESVIIYKTMCHKPCGLGDQVKRNERGHEALQRCWAMQDGVFCRVCKHNYKDHMHIYYDYRPTTHRHQDAAVNERMVRNGTNIELQREAIRIKSTAIAEFKLEYSQVQDAAIQFGFFLKRHAIEPYNDATVEYVDHLIDVERLKVNSGGKKETLKMLEKYKAEHLQKVAAITKAMDRGDDDLVLDDRGVLQLITSLYGLPHFGEDLERIVKVNEMASDAVFREKTYNVSAGRHWDGQRHKERRHSTKQSRPQPYATEFPGHQHSPRQESWARPGSPRPTYQYREKTVPGQFPQEADDFGVHEGYGRAEAPVADYGSAVSYWSFSAPIRRLKRYFSRS
ncbi:hypothetical protein B0T16DRAFT_419696 [Cercophora newfieldiana]|uniref:G domain-containing protein n=1 Tax=Cercophora newfieldiana TaxID=92897 RepID=A0AA39XW44_9PEZI|nr:hypothetical protein B0T16DRAFT_419696 [Cercophora newfieldiana]